MANQPFDERIVLWTPTSIANATGTLAVQISSLSTILQQRIDRILISSTDTVDHTVTLLLGTNPICDFVVPAGAGQGTVDMVDALSKIRPNNEVSYLLLPVSTSLSLKPAVAVTSGKFLFVHTMGGYL